MKGVNYLIHLVLYVQYKQIEDEYVMAVDMLERICLLGGDL